MPYDLMPSHGFVREFYNRAIIAPAPGTTNAPPSYAIACALAALGGVLQDKLIVPQGPKPGPCLWTLLVGDTATEKSLVIRYVTKVIQRVEGMKDLVSVTEGSAAGILKTLKSRSSLLLLFSEFGHTLRQSADRGWNAELRPALIALSDQAPMKKVLAKGDVDVQRPLVSLLAGVNMALFEAAATTEDLYGGFLGRFAIWLPAGLDGEPSARWRPPEPIRRRQPLRDEAVSHLAGMLQERLGRVAAAAEDGDVEVCSCYGPEADKLWIAFMDYLDEKCAKTGGEIDVVMRRVEAHVDRIACILATDLQEDPLVVGEEAMHHATEIGKYLLDTLVLFANEYAPDDQARLQDRCYKLILKAGPEGLRIRYLGQSLKRRKRDLREALDSLIEYHRIVESPTDLFIADKFREGDLANARAMEHPAPPDMPLPEDDGPQGGGAAAEPLSNDPLGLAGLEPLHDFDPDADAEFAEWASGEAKKDADPLADKDDD